MREIINGVKGPVYLRQLIALSADGESLPTEFRVFRAGVNETTKGPIVFDSDAAAAVMRAYAERGVELAIDLEHDSVSEDARTARNDAGDARGWARLELRAGELWAVNVRWTPDGERRLRERTQRYISPVVFLDEENHALEIYNLALVSQPATHGAVPLVARATAANAAGNTGMRERIRLALAAARAGDEAALVKLGLDAKMAKDALGIVKEGNGEAALALVESMLVAMVSGEEPEAGEPADVEPESEPLAETPEETPEEREEMAALRAQAAAAVKLRADNGRLLSELTELRAERAERETAERVELIRELVKLGAELPALAWEDPAADSPRPSKRLAREELTDMRERVEAYRAAPQTGGHQPPEGAPLELSADEQRWAEDTERKHGPEARAKFVSRLAQKRSRRDK